MHKKEGTILCTLYDRIISLCKERGVSGSRMCLDLGLSKSTLSNMKSGRTAGLTATTAQKIASYFGVSVGCLLGEEDCSEGIKKEHPTDDLGEMSEKKQELIKFAMSLSEAEAQKMLQIMKTILATD